MRDASMRSELQTIIDQLVDGAVTEYVREQTFVRLLQDTPDDERDELAAYIHDSFTTHLELPSDVIVRLEAVEEYLGHRLGIADCYTRQGATADVR
jgi:hypothetical protein